MDHTKVKEFLGEDLYNKIKDNLDRNELRKAEYVVVFDWVVKSIVNQTLVSLIEKDLVDIVGVKAEEDGELTPDFRQRITNESY